MMRRWIFVIAWLLLFPALAQEPEAGGHVHSHERKVAAPALIDVTAAELLAEVKRRDAKVVLVNLWAVWCEPCKDEMPHLIELARSYRERGLEVMLVSVDFESERPHTQGFLSEMGVDFPTYFRSGDDDETFIFGLHKEWSGSLPATLLFDEHGTLVRFWEGDASKAFFEARILDVLEGRDDAHPETLVKP